MKTINLKQAEALAWCWFDNKERRKQLERYAAEKSEWTALDILRLPADEVSSDDKLFVVLHPSLIDKPILHSLACDFAERAAAWAARDAAWAAARAAAWAARDAARDAAWASARAAARAAAWDARDARDAERAAAWAARAAARAAAWDARDARDAARDAERAWQVSHVIEVLEAEYEAD